MRTETNNNLGKVVEMRSQACGEHADQDLAVAFVDRQGSLPSSDAPSTAFGPVKGCIFWEAPSTLSSNDWSQGGEPSNTLLSNSGLFGLNCGNTAEGGLKVASAVPLPKDLLIAPINIVASGLAP